MLLPFNRQSMRERNLLDQIENWKHARHGTVAQRLRSELELCDLVRALRQTPKTKAASRRDLAEKSRLWVAPLKAIAKAKRKRQANPR
jgi:hypothetical protein